MGMVFCQTEIRLKAFANFAQIFKYIFGRFQIVVIGSDNTSNGDKLQSGGREGG